MTTRFIGALLVAFALGCGGGEETPTPSPATPVEPAPPTPAPPTPAPPTPVPPTASGCTIPDGELRGDATAGAEKYKLFCVTCHGAGGKGDGIAAPKDPPPADHTDAAYMGGLTDQNLYKVISCGGPSVEKSALMAAWGAIIDEQGIKDLIAHLRTLSGT